MKQQLNVYGVNLDGRHRGIVAATSMKSAAGLLGIPYGHARAYGSQTWDCVEVGVAMSKPGVVFKRSYRDRNETAWVEATK